MYAAAHPQGMGAISAWYSNYSAVIYSDGLNRGGKGVGSTADEV